MLCVLHYNDVTIIAQDRVVDMKIRKMKKKDYPAVERLSMQLHRVHRAGRPELFTDVEYRYLPEFFESLLSNQEIISILAEADHRVVGVCFASLLSTSGMVRMRTAYIDEIVVDERYRRKGIGKALFLEAEKRAREQGAERVDLMVWSFNEDAIKFYEYCGMRPQRCIYEKGIGEGEV